MTFALINGSTVLQVFDGFPPVNTPLLNGVQISTVGPFPLPVTFEDGSQLVSATYSDMQEPGTVATGYDLAQWTVVNGVASGPRTWQTVAPPVYGSCTRAQGLRALLHVGGMTNVEATIAGAIATISDPIKREDTQIAFGAATWYRADLISNASLLSMTEAQVDALLSAAQSY